VKVELRVTLKTIDNVLLAAGSVYTDPLPQDVAVELRDRPWNVKVLDATPALPNAIPPKGPIEPVKKRIKREIG
jgi:hypothetical protein